MDCELHRQEPLVRIDEFVTMLCGNAARQYVVATISDSGEIMTYSSLGQTLDEAAISQFLDISKLREAINHGELEAAPVVDDGFSANYGISANTWGSRRMQASEYHRSPSVEHRDSVSRRRRKRPRFGNGDNVGPISLPQPRSIRVGDSKAMCDFYEQQFKNCQQTICKLIAKAWIRTLEPKKQSIHPYVGSEAKAPDWWPKPWGPSRFHKVRHKEPDHLYKHERVKLLVHILKLVVEPKHRQHGQLQKLQIDVQSLERTTTEALSSIFKNEKCANKRPYLKLLFEVARQDEQFRNGELDMSTEICTTMEGDVPRSRHRDEGAITNTKVDGYAPQQPQINTEAYQRVARPHNSTICSSWQPMDGTANAITGDLSITGNPCDSSVPMEMQAQTHLSWADNWPHVEHGTATRESSLDTARISRGARRPPSMSVEYAGSAQPDMYAKSRPHCAWTGPLTPSAWSSMTAWKSQGVADYDVPEDTGSVLMGKTTEVWPLQQHFNERQVPVPHTTDISQARSG